MKSYADTSFLVSLYSSDVNSARADLWRQANPVPLAFTPLHALEFRNALWQSVFKKARNPNDVREVLQEIETDITAELLVKPTGDFDEVWKLARDLADAHTMALGARSLDILHVAAAQWLQVEELVTFDHRQSALVLRIGLKVAVI
jgi:predicted nucleic acid-binding protein